MALALVVSVAWATAGFVSIREGTMPRNAAKSRCEVDGCRAWAVRGERFCSSHLSRAHGGAPVGNDNAVTRGLYSRHFTVDELAVVLDTPSDLTDEIAACRVLLGRLVAAMSGGDSDLIALSGMALRA